MIQEFPVGIKDTVLCTCGHGMKVMRISVDIGV